MKVAAARAVARARATARQHGDRHPHQIERVAGRIAGVVPLVDPADFMQVIQVPGPLIEHDPAFPRRVNVHVVEVYGPDEVRMRTWERGSGITMACGTGACAVCVAGVLTGRTSRRVLAHLPGGDPDLRKAIAAYLCDFRAVRCHPDQIVIVAGMQQAMLLSAIVVLNPGEPAWIEDPCY